MPYPIIGYPNPPPPGLNEAVEGAGIQLSNVGGVWMAATEEQAQRAAAIAATYDPLPYVIAMRKEEAAYMKESVEVGGITTTGGVPLDTAMENQLRLLRLACSTEANPLPQTFMVKDRNGTFWPLDRAAARILGRDINAFFQGCVAGEGNAVAAITAPGLTWQQIMTINLAGFFPVNS
jgi:hypothetical protein